MNRIIGSDLEEVVKSRIVNSITSTQSLNTRTFYFGQVISNQDPKNLNRIKIRIPILDDHYFANGVSNDEGAKQLTWCLPFSHRFIEIPETNAIVVVAVLDVKTPYFGRMYFDTISELSTTDIFERLTPEINSLSNWVAPEEALNISFTTKPSNNSFNGTANVNYKVGLRGKGKNKFVLDKDSSTWIQNEKDKEKESFMILAENTQIETADNISIYSKKGYSTHYHPVFHTPLYDYLKDVNKMLQKIIHLLNTKPAIAKSGPCLPGPSAPKLIIELKSLSEQLEHLRKTGNSLKISIN